MTIFFITLIFPLLFLTFGYYRWPILLTAIATGFLLANIWQYSRKFFTPIKLEEHYLTENHQQRLSSYQNVRQQIGKLHHLLGVNQQALTNLQRGQLIGRNVEQAISNKVLERQILTQKLQQKLADSYLLLKLLQGNLSQKEFNFLIQIKQILFMSFLIIMGIFSTRNVGKLPKIIKQQIKTRTLRVNF